MRTIFIVLVVLILIGGGVWLLRPAQMGPGVQVPAAKTTAVEDSTIVDASQPNPGDDNPVQNPNLPTPTAESQASKPRVGVCHPQTASDDCAPLTTGMTPTPRNHSISNAKPGRSELASPSGLANEDKTRIIPALSVHGLPKPGTIKEGSLCWVREYRHKANSRALPIDEFLEHLNAFPLERPDIQPKSICVKVDGTPVDFVVSSRGQKKEIVIGPVVGPESIIRVSYCTGSARCGEACAKPARRFMDELTGDVLTPPHGPTGRADSPAPTGRAAANSPRTPALSHHEADTAELRAGLNELKALARTNDSLTDHAILRDWNTLVARERTCKEN